MDDRQPSLGLPSDNASEPGDDDQPHTTGHGSRRDESACTQANPANTKSLKPST
jgi:hypothetical protein